MMILRTRKEQYLNEIVGNGNTAPRTPYTREELFFADILGEVNAPVPVTRIEIYLAKIANKYSGELPEPKTRIEKFIARAAGMDVTIPTPITREEMFWADYALIVEKEISGIPPLTFNAIAGTLKNYRIYGNTETKTRSYSGSAPLSFPIVDGAVSNYRIYGNTENGESVGDLVTDSQSEYYGKYAIPITNNSKTSNIYLDEPLTRQGNNADYIDYAEQKRYNADGTSEDVTLPALPAHSSTNSLSIGTTVQPSSVAVDVAEVVSCGDKTENLWNENKEILTNINKANNIYIYDNSSASVVQVLDMPFSITEDGTYIISFNARSSANSIIIVDGQPDNLYSGIEPDATVLVTEQETRYSIVRHLKAGNTRIRIFRSALTSGRDNIVYIREIQLEFGDTSTSYEPYGKYKIPVTLTADSTETTDIYLDTPLAKSGDIADYIDYAAQKRRNSDGTESSVTLPEIAVTAGTNTLTIGTEVQPSNVYIKYEGER